MAAETSVGVQSVGRAFHLLHLMSEAGGQMSISELAAASGLPLPTIHRIIRTLTESGHVRQNASRQYTLGPRLVGLGESASRMLAAGSQPDLRELADVAGETANMALYDGDRAVYVAQVPSHHSMRMFTELGRRVHLHATGVGKALLSQMPDSAVRRIMTSTGMPAMTDRTITDLDVLLQVLAEIRERGHAVDDGEHEFGVRCVAVPVPDAPTLTAISVSGPESRLTAEVMERVVPLLRATATAVAKRFA
ncbi:IclR family transcriptional regulator [Pseudonocardia alaniniphila]|nr:IclR family transcriptional regulator [Pseudonocardia alaniniphila]